jgi:hypothetical protein
MMKKYICLFFILIIVALNACTTRVVSSALSPIIVTKNFIRALNKGEKEKALDYVCESMILPGLPENFLENDHYNLVNNDQDFALVNVVAEIRVDSLMAAIKKNMDFNLELEKRSDGWCIRRDSLINIAEYLADYSL